MESFRKRVGLVTAYRAKIAQCKVKKKMFLEISTLWRNIFCENSGNAKSTGTFQNRIQQVNFRSKNL